MTGGIVNHLWQSTVFLIAAALAAFALRRNQASVRHAVWLAASLKFLVPFSILIGLGGAFAWRSTPARAAPVAPAIVETVQTITEPFAEVSAGPGWANTAQSPMGIPWPTVLGAVWICGALVVIAVRIRGWLNVRNALRASTPTTLAGVEKSLDVRATPGLLEPGVVGIWRPVLLLPVGLESTLSAVQLHAVVAHEMHHIRRRDNLTSALHMIVEALFWFHPLVWWVGARLIDERERACDEHVLASGAAPDAYAESILSVCKRYVELPVACVSGVTGSDLKKRINAILTGQVGLALSGARKAVLVLAAIAALAVPVAAGMLTAPLRTSTQAAPTANTQKFEVASIKPCEPGTVVPGARSGGGGSGSFSPGRVHLDCFVVKNLIDTAYVANRDARDPNDPINAWPGLGLAQQSDGPQRIRGGPAWVYSDKYTIEAKMPGPVPDEPDGPRSAARAAMLGPMLRALLEERFHLKLHQDTEEAPMFALTVAKGGLKITPMKDGDCTMDRLKPPVLLSEAARRGVKPTCGTVHGGPDGPNWLTEHGGQDLGVVAMMLSSDLGVKVIDRTGVTDKFNISWEYGPDENTPGSLRWLERYGPQPPVPPTAPSIFTALEQQLGLKLVPIKAPRGYLVIDQIERPTPDDPLAILAPARAAGAGRVNRQ